MPYAVEVLHNEDGPILLVRAGSAAEALALAADEAASNDLAVTDTEDSIRIGWVRATPCNPAGHEYSDGFSWCDGGMRCHYAYGKPGPGAFRGAFVNVRYLMPGERVEWDEALNVAPTSESPVPDAADRTADPAAILDETGTGFCRAVSQHGAPVTASGEITIRSRIGPGS